jgi:hypothetical protein
LILGLGFRICNDSKGTQDSDAVFIPKDAFMGWYNPTCKMGTWLYMNSNILHMIIQEI